jgi:hypothetical protein
LVSGHLVSRSRFEKLLSTALTNHRKHKQNEIEEIENKIRRDKVENIVRNAKYNVKQ